jgi:hypothetical protein
MGNSRLPSLGGSSCDLRHTQAEVFVHDLFDGWQFSLDQPPLCDHAQYRPI